MRPHPHPHPPTGSRALGSPALRVAIAVLALAAAGGCRGLGPAAPLPEIDPAARERFARRSLEDARAFRSQDRLPQAERVLRRGLSAKPDAAELHRALAQLLEELDRPEQAQAHWLRADEIDPPPPPPPDRPLELSSHGALVILLEPEPDHEPPQRVAHDWPNGVVAETLQARLRVRLPEATVVHAEPETVARARAWLSERGPRAAISLRADRAHCGESIKDGAFGLAWLRVATATPGRPAAATPSRPAAATPGGPGLGPDRIREVVDNPRPPRNCEPEAVARALETAFALPALREALRAPAEAEAHWSTGALRALFPGLGRRIAAQLGAGRTRLASGDLAGAEEAFRSAARIDPEDPDVSTYLREVEATLALSRSLPAADEADPAALDPRFSAAQRAGVEARLADERRRLDDLIAALAVVEEEAQLPAAQTLAALRPTELPDIGGFGPQLARARAGGEVEARAAYAPGNGLLARYYFAVGAELPVLREEDTDGDRRPDRWTGYEGAQRRAIWQDGSGSGRPDTQLVFAPGGAVLERIELDSDGDGRAERVFGYDAGALRRDSRDSDGDGVIDRFDHFDAEGKLTLREEDLDADGRIDLRSFFRAGKLARREVTTPELSPVPLEP